jgi:hypothetical protein
MAYFITPVTWDIMPDGGIRYYINRHNITAGYVEQQKHIKGMLGMSYQILMDTLKQQIKGFDLDCSHWGEEQNIQLEIQGNELLLFSTYGNTQQKNIPTAVSVTPSANGLAGK